MGLPGAPRPRVVIAANVISRSAILMAINDGGPHAGKGAECRGSPPESRPSPSNLRTGG